MLNQQHIVAVLGASPKPARFANKAIKLLLKHNYTVIPVHPNFESIENLAVKKKLAEIEQPIDTLTLYVGAEKLDQIVDDVIAAKPKRVIFNPGTESAALMQALDAQQIEYVRDCTLIMLDNNRF